MDAKALTKGRVFSGYGKTEEDSHPQRETGRERPLFVLYPWGLGVCDLSRCVCAFKGGGDCVSTYWHVPPPFFRVSTIRRNGVAINILCFFGGGTKKYVCNSLSLSSVSSAI